MIKSNINKNARGTGNKKSQNKIGGEQSILPRQCMYAVNQKGRNWVAGSYIYYGSFIIM